MNFGYEVVYKTGIEDKTFRCTTLKDAEKCMEELNDDIIMCGIYPNYDELDKSNYEDDNFVKGIDYRDHDIFIGIYNVAAEKRIFMNN